MAQKLASKRSGNDSDGVSWSSEATYAYSTNLTPRFGNALRKKTKDTSSSSEDSIPSGNHARSSIHGRPPVNPGSANEASPRRRRRLRNQGVLQLDAEHELHRAPPQRSLLNEVLADVRQFPVATYRYWKWVVLVYLWWMLVTHLTAAAYVSITERFEPLCTLPWIGPRLPLCDHQVRESTKPVNITKISASQRQLETVMDSAGRGMGLAMNMLANEYAIRDLSIRVKHSGLGRKGGLGRELDQLIGLTTKTSDGLSDFTSRVASVTDSIIGFDRYAIRNLQAITDRQENPPSLPQIVISALSPLSAFQPKYKTELELKDVFLRTTSEMTSRLRKLIEEAGHLRYLLRRISDVLDRIKGLAIDEIKDAPELAVLAELWMKLARPDDFKEHQSHQVLLTDITAYYANAMEVMKATLHALNRMRSELNEFRDIHASPALVWRDVPLEVTIEMMRGSMKRLELGRMKIDGYEERHEAPALNGRRYIEASIRRQG